MCYDKSFTNNDRKGGCHGNRKDRFIFGLAESCDDRFVNIFCKKEEQRASFCNWSSRFLDGYRGFVQSSL